MISFSFVHWKPWDPCVEIYSRLSQLNGNHSQLYCSLNTAGDRSASTLQAGLRVVLAAASGERMDHYRQLQELRTQSIAAELEAVKAELQAVKAEPAGAVKAEPAGAVKAELEAVKAELEAVKALEVRVALLIDSPPFFFCHSMFSQQFVEPWN
eukprot:COSAG02_NODE_6479_length_3547_cov_90.720708_2_plen_154_part_00